VDVALHNPAFHSIVCAPFGKSRPTVPPPDPVETLLVLALDLLSQTEAQHRAARRLEEATQSLSNGVRSRGAYDTQRANQVRHQLNRIRNMADVQRTLLREFDRELHDWLSGIS
jgi:hypothetical protein